MFAPSDSDAEFPETPSSEEVENVVKALQQELVVGAFDETLVREGETVEVKWERWSKVLWGGNRCQAGQKVWNILMSL